MKASTINDRARALRDEMKAAVRIETREIDGQLVEVKVYPGFPRERLPRDRREPLALDAQEGQHEGEAMKLDDLVLRFNVLIRRYRLVDGAGQAEQVGDTWEEIVNPNKPPRRYIVVGREDREGGGIDLDVDEYDPDFNFRGTTALLVASVVATVYTMWLLY